MAKSRRKVDRSRSKSSSKSSVKSAFDGKTVAVIAHKGYKVLNKLGQGAFGVVYKAVNRDGQLSAVKVIDLTKMTNNGREKYLPREITTLIDCRHENLIQVYDIFRAENKMITNGDISGYAKKHNGITEQLACKWFYQSASGLSYLHEVLKTAHRDIKLDNILLDGNFVAKLTDFGFAKQCFDNDKHRVILSSTFCGTLPYECPQILEHKPYDAFKADCWSMGVTLFIMLFSAFPFHYKDRKQMLNEIKDYPKYLQARFMAKKLPGDALQLMEHLLHPDEAKRASVHAILSNRYILNNKAK
ncbi:protein serine threonine kinase [Tyrophagus putrescentiae]|nr:protein serine threonine kinase [Tyrophagus putrescentiae]